MGLYFKRNNTLNVGLLVLLPLLTFLIFVVCLVCAIAYCRFRYVYQDKQDKSEEQKERNLKIEFSNGEIPGEKTLNNGSYKKNLDFTNSMSIIHSSPVKDTNNKYIDLNHEMDELEPGSVLDKADPNDLEVSVYSQEPEWYKAAYLFEADDENQLSLSPGQVVEVVEKLETGWWRGYIDDRVGWFPESYVFALSAADQGCINEGFERSPEVARRRMHRSHSQPAILSPLQSLDHLSPLILNLSQPLTKSPSSATSSRSYKAVCIYKPSAPDEIAVHPDDDLVHINRDPINGWVKVRNKSSSEIGWVPRECLQALRDDEDGIEPPESPSSDTHSAVDWDGDFEEQDEVSGLAYRVMYDYTGEQDGDLSMMMGDVVVVFEKMESGWWRGCCRGIEGWFPGSYVQMIPQSPSSDDSGYTSPRSGIPHLDNLRTSLNFQSESSTDEDNPIPSIINASSTSSSAEDPILPKAPKRTKKPKVIKIKSGNIINLAHPSRPTNLPPPQPELPPFNDRILNVILESNEAASARSSLVLDDSAELTFCTDKESNTSNVSPSYEKTSREVDNIDGHKHSSNNLEHSAVDETKLPFHELNSATLPASTQEIPPSSDTLEHINGVVEFSCNKILPTVNNDLNIHSSALCTDGLNPLDRSFDVDEICDEHIDENLIVSSNETQRETLSTVHNVNTDDDPPEHIKAFSNNVSGSNIAEEPFQSEIKKVPVATVKPVQLQVIDDTEYQSAHDNHMSIKKFNLTLDEMFDKASLTSIDIDDLLQSADQSLSEETFLESDLPPPQLDGDSDEDKSDWPARVKLEIETSSSHSDVFPLDGEPPATVTPPAEFGNKQLTSGIKNKPKVKSPVNARPDHPPPAKPPQSNSSNNIHHKLTPLKLSKDDISNPIAIVNGIPKQPNTTKVEIQHVRQGNEHLTPKGKKYLRSNSLPAMDRYGSSLSSGKSIFRMPRFGKKSYSPKKATQVVDGQSRRIDYLRALVSPPKTAPPPRPPPPRFDKLSIKKIRNGRPPTTLQLTRSSYRATDDSELSYSEGSFIKTISKADRPGWMVGMLPDGTTGMYRQNILNEMSAEDQSSMA